MDEGIHIHTESRQRCVHSCTTWPHHVPNCVHSEGTFPSNVQRPDGGMFPLRVLIPLLLGQHAFSQNFDTSLQLNASLSLNSSALSSDSFALPPSANSPSQARRTVSVALCSVQDFASPTRFFASNNSDVTSPGPQSAQSDVYELVVGENGYANLTLTFDGDGAGGGLGEGVFAVDVAGQVIFEVGVTNIAGAFLLYRSSAGYMLRFMQNRFTPSKARCLFSETQRPIKRSSFRPPFLPHPCQRRRSLTTPSQRRT